MRTITATIAWVLCIGTGIAQVSEDFECPAWTCPGWSAVAGSGGAVDAAAAHDGLQGFAGTGGWFMKTATIGAPGERLSAWTRFPGTGGRTYLGFDATPAGAKSFVFAPNSGDIRFQENPSYSYTELNTTPVAMAIDTWYRMEIEFVDPFNVTGNLYAADGVTLLASVSQLYAGGITPGNIALRGFNGHHVDTIGSGVPTPMCTVAGPPGTSAGDITIDITTSTMASPTVSIGLDASTDGGNTFFACTAAATSPIGNPAVGVPVGAATFVWDSVADGVGTTALAPGVLVRATVNDGVAPMSGSCTSAPFDVDSSTTCTALCGDCNQDRNGPTILDALIGAQIAAALLTPSLLQTTCCDVDANLRIDILDALRMAQAAAALPVAIVCP